MDRPTKIPRGATTPRFRGTILIGGRIPESLLRRLAAAVALDCLPDKPRGRIRIDSREVERRMREAAKSSKQFSVSASRASFGRFERAESFCFDNRIAFRRRSEARGAHDAEMLAFLPARRRR